jgi:hypothetical protein
MQKTLIAIIVTAMVGSSIQDPKPYPGTQNFPLTFEIKEPPASHKGEDSEKYLSTMFPFTTETTSYKFRPHLGQRTVLHGNKAYTNPDFPKIKLDWGVDCKKENNCEYDLKSADLYYYDGNTWNITDSTTQFSLFKGEKPDLTAKPLDSKLVFKPTTGDNWLFDNAGILGLAPTSSLWEYLFGQYKFKNDEINFAFWMNTDKKNTYTELFEESDINIYGGSQIKFSDDATKLLEAKDDELNFVDGLDSPLGKNYWGIKGVSVHMSDNMDKPLHENVEACISSMGVETLISSHFGLAGERVMKQVCGNPKGCDASNDLSYAPDIYITYKDTNQKLVNITVTAQDYMYYNSNGKDIAASIGDMSDYEVVDCRGGAQFGLGKMFLFKRLVIMKMLKDKDGNMKSQVSINKYKTRPSLVHNKNVTVVVVFGVGATVLILLVIFVIRSKGDPNRVVGGSKKGDTDFNSNTDGGEYQSMANESDRNTLGTETTE